MVGLCGCLLMCFVFLLGVDFWNDVGDLPIAKWNQDRPSWGILGRSWGRLGGVLGVSWAVLGGSWPHLQKCALSLGKMHITEGSG